MSINYILGSDSITVYLDSNSYTINRQAETFEPVLEAVRADDTDMLRGIVNLRKTIHASLVTGSDKVRIVGNSIFCGEHEVSGLISSRIFDILRMGLDATSMIKFLENLMENPSNRAVNELFGFLDSCKLPITADGHFLAYKRINDDYTDCHTGTFNNSPGQVLEMPRNRVDEDKDRTCSSGFHFCSYDYLKHFWGDRIVVLKINPRDVVAIPSDYNNAKGRTARYEVVDEIPLDEYKVPTYTITDSFTDEYSQDVDDEYVDEDDDILDRWGDDDDDDEYFGFGTESDLINILVEMFDDEKRKAKEPDSVRKVFIPSDKTTTAPQNDLLTSVEVRNIRSLIDSGWTLAGIARKFAVSPRTIARIRDGETYTHVK